MSDALFRQKAPKIMRDLMHDFQLTTDDAAAILGNLGAESGGFAFLQEKKPLVPGSKGGYGWAQWTGPRRQQFEAYCARNKLDPASDKANYGWLFNELKGSEAGAIAKLKAAKGLENKVVAFEKAFERSGIPHYDSRYVWARKALAAYLGAGGETSLPPVKAPPDVEPVAPTVHPPITAQPPVAVQTKKPAAYVGIGAAVGAAILAAIGAFFRVMGWV